jgi:uncharacterized membrane protein YkgB
MTSKTGADRSANALIIVALGIIFIWFGGIKFTSGGAMAIEGLVNNSPILSWVYSVFSVQAFAAILGALEIVIGILLIVGIRDPRVRAISGLAATVTFLVTLSFMLSTPGVVPEGASFPVLSGMPGEFLLKDLVLLAVSWAVFVSGKHALTGREA